MKNFILCYKNKINKHTKLLWKLGLLFRAKLHLNFTYPRFAILASASLTQPIKACGASQALTAKLGSILPRIDIDWW